MAGRLAEQGGQGGLGSGRGQDDWRRAKAAGPRSSVLQSVASAPQARPGLPALPERDDGGRNLGW